MTYTNETDANALLVVRDDTSMIRGRVTALHRAFEYGSSVSLLFDEDVLARYSFVRERLDRSWERPAEPARLQGEWRDEYVEFRTSLPDQSGTIDGLLDIATEREFWVFSEVVVFDDDSWLFYIPVGADPAHAAFLRTGPDEQFVASLRDELADLPAAILSRGTRERWTDGDRWFQIHDAYLSVYEEDISELSEEEREYYTTHADFSLARIEGIVVNQETETIRLQWTGGDSGGGFGAIVGVVTAWFQPDPPELLRFEDTNTFDRVAEELTSTVEAFWPNSSGTSIGGDPS